MDIRTLQYFMETVRCGSFSRAAEKLHVTQSAVSKKIRYLEEEVDALLLVRHGRGLQLTDTGHIVYKQAQEILQAMGRMSVELEKTKTLHVGHLTVGIPPMINIICTPVLKAFRERYPDVTLLLQEDTGPMIEAQVAHGELEIGMTILPAESDLGLHTYPVARYPIYAVAKTGTFQEHRETLHVKDLKDMPLVLLKNAFGLTRVLQGIFLQEGFVPTIAAQSSQWDWLVAMAASGVGVALLPEPFIHRLADNQLQAVRLVSPDVMWEIAYVTKGEYLSHAARAWLEVSEKVLGVALPSQVAVPQ
jgi:DNA-binding transcriptional LysR family regulator